MVLSSSRYCQIVSSQIQFMLSFLVWSCMVMYKLEAWLLDVAHVDGREKRAKWCHFLSSCKNPTQAIKQNHGLEIHCPFKMSFLVQFFLGKCQGFVTLVAKCLHTVSKNLLLEKNPFAQPHTIKLLLLSFHCWFLWGNMIWVRERERCTWCGKAQLQQMSAIGQVTLALRLVFSLV